MPALVSCLMSLAAVSNDTFASFAHFFGVSFQMQASRNSFRMLRGKSRKVYWVLPFRVNKRSHSKILVELKENSSAITPNYFTISKLNFLNILYIRTPRSLRNKSKSVLIFPDKLSSGT